MLPPQDAVDADEDAASAVLEDWMSRLATLARAAPQLAFPHLTQQIEERRQLLLVASAGRATGGADMDVVRVADRGPGGGGLGAAFMCVAEV